MAQALGGLTIDGLKTTIPLHKALAQSEGGARQRCPHTQYLEPWLEANPIKSE